VKRRILITGASGFVGRHLTHRLDAPSHEIFGTSYPHRPEDLEPACTGEICHLDIRDEGRLKDFLDRVRPDWVFHLAAISSVGLSWKKRRETMETNFMGTLNLLESLRETAPRARVLFVSSADVYGRNGGGPEGLLEEDAVHAASLYAVSKISGELLCRFCAENEGLDVVLARSFPHTGPGQAADFVCSDWARQIALIEQGRAEPVIRIGNIEVERDFTDVRDVVNAYRLLMEKGRAGEIYNVASGRAVVLRDVMDMLLGEAGRDIEILVDPERFRKADIPVLVGDPSKLRAETGWVP